MHWRDDLRSHDENRNASSSPRLVDLVVRWRQTAESSRSACRRRGTSVAGAGTWTGAGTLDIDEQVVRPAGKALNVSYALAWMGGESVAAGLWGREDYDEMRRAVDAAGRAD